jgi:hypothetical protein
MQASVAQHYEWLQERGLPLRYSHMMDEVRVLVRPGCVVDLGHAAA